MPPVPTTSALGNRYAPHIADICGFVAAVAARHRLLAPLLVLVWVRLRRIVLRLDRLALRVQRGRPAPSPARGARKPPAIPPAHAQADTQPAHPGRPSRTPQGQAWLLRLHQPMAQWAPRIHLLVNDPDIAALCAAAPQAGRLLRPLCRMFGVTPPPHIFRAPAPRKPRPREPGLRKPEKPKPPPFAEHSPNVWPFVPLRLRLRVPGLRRRKPPD